MNVLLKFHDPSAPPNPLNENGYFLRNGLCLPIMNSQPALPTELITVVPTEESTDNESDDESQGIPSSDEDIDDDDGIPSSDEDIDDDDV